MTVTSQLRTRARSRPARIVLPEGDDPRVVQAAVRARQEGVAHPVLLGKPEEIATLAEQAQVDISGIPSADPVTSPLREELAIRYRAARRESASLDTEVLELLANPIYFGTMLVESGAADGMVAGARSSTAGTIEPALKIRRLHPGLGPITSCFIMELGVHSQVVAKEGALIFTDCALNPEPSPVMLAQIAAAGARAVRDLCGMEPRVAFLSFSTHGSASHERVSAVSEAVAHLRKRAPGLAVDGELQADAALVPAVAALKSPSSPVAGRANVLVFPNLESGNIGYKLVERLAGARAIGPIFSGLNWPINDLSRGCSVDDIIDMLAITSIQVAASKAGSQVVSR